MKTLLFLPPSQQKPFQNQAPQRETEEGDHEERLGSKVIS